MPRTDFPESNASASQNHFNVGQVSGRQIGNRFVAVVMLFAAMNALSYFYWSWGWGNLFGNPEAKAVGIGFPVRFFLHYSPMVQPVFDAPLLLADLAIGVAAAFAIGLTFSSTQSEASPNKIQGSEHQETNVDSPPKQRMRFTIGELLIGSAIIAIVLFLAGPVDQPKVSALKVIYLAGPIMLAWTALMLARMGQGIQLGCTFAFAAILIVASGFLAEQIPDIKDFTRGLMGIFVCWIPQITLIAAIITWFYPIQK